MFTGLIREIAKVRNYQNNILTIISKHKAKLGDSIAINGICLTVIKVNIDGFDLELADETRSIIDESKISGSVHIEPAMQLTDRFEGHIVQGHIDCIGVVDSIIQRSNATDFIIKGIKFRNAICYEATCNEIYSGDVEFVIAISNNAWFRPSIEPTLQRLLLKFYAKKYNIVIYHTTNGDGSGVILPNI